MDPIQPIDCQKVCAVTSFQKVVIRATGKGKVRWLKIREHATAGNHNINTAQVWLVRNQALYDGTARPPDDDVVVDTGTFTPTASATLKSWPVTVGDGVFGDNAPFHDGLAAIIQTTVSGDGTLILSGEMESEP